MMNKHCDTDVLLRRALAVEKPDPALLGRVKASMRKERDMRTSIHTKRIITLALAAALLLALGVTAWAVLDPGEWFKYYFSLGGELTEGQQEYIDSAAVGIGQSASADGWTVTLESSKTKTEHVPARSGRTWPPSCTGASPAPTRTRRRTSSPAAGRRR